MKWLLVFAALLFLLPLQPVRAVNAASSYVELFDSPTMTVDWSRGDTQAVTLHGNRTLIFSNGRKGGKYLLILKQDAQGSRTVTMPASVRWPGVNPPSDPPFLTTTANKTDYITFFYDGVTYDALGVARDY